MNNVSLTQDDETELNETGLKESKFLYFVLWGLGIAVLIALGVGAKLFWDVNLITYFDLGPSCVAIALILLATSIKTRGLNQYGIAFFYKRPLKLLSVGPHLIPIGVMQFETYSKEIQEFQCPDEPDKVFKGHDSDTLPDGQVRPIRITTGAPKRNSKTGETIRKGGVLAVQSTFIASFVFRWRIQAGGKNIFRTLQTLGLSFKDIKTQVEKQLRDIGEAVVAEYASEKTMEQFIAGLRKVNAALLEESSTRFGDTGIEIISALLISPDLGQTTSESLATIPKARADAQNKIVLAEAKEIELTRAGVGNANAARALLDAKASGQKRIMEALDVSGESVLASEAVAGLSEKTDVIIAGAQGGMTDVMGLVKGAESALKTKAPPKPKGGES